jgi:hypothetical protein
MNAPALASQLPPALPAAARQLGARAFVFEFAEVGEQEYEAVMEAVGPAPRGRLFHCAGPAEEGWMVVEVWDSQESFDAFLTERLLPVVRKIGLFASLPHSFGVHNVVAGPY